MAKDKACFIIYKSLYEPIKDLTQLEKGELFEAIMEYQTLDSYDHSKLTPLVKMSFKFFKNQFDIDNEKYLAMCLKNSDNANMRWHATASDGMRPDAVDADIRYKIEDKRRKMFNPPTKLEVYEHYISQGLNEKQATDTADRFWNFYDSKGWTVGKNKMKKWKSATHQFIRVIENNQGSDHIFLEH